MSSESRLMLRYHSGGCCGIKTISGFFQPPSSMAKALRPLTNQGLDKQRYHFSGDRFYPFEAPRETHLERFDRFLAYLEKFRHGSLVEIATTRQTLYVGWSDDIFESRGFKVVSSFENGGGPEVRVWHKLIDPVEVLCEDCDEHYEDCVCDF